MSLDIYDPCPCESGKKLKFCCAAIVGEMEKAARLLQNNQPRMAMQILDALDKSHPANPWIATTRASLLFREDRFDEAKDTVAEILNLNPNHAFGLALYAIAVLVSDGYPAARTAIGRAFRGSAALHPQVVGDLAIQVTNYLWRDRKFMAARQHLAFAMRLVSDEERREIFMRLLDLDGSQAIPYPLRGTHAFASYSGSDDANREFNKAMRLSAGGCWEAAGALFTRLAEADPQSAGLCQNAGLCRAYIGDEEGAAKWLHQAAQLEGDFEAALELETLAQLLDYSLPERQMSVKSTQYITDSVSKLLSRLDGQKQIARLELPDDVPRDAESGALPVGLFQILDREIAQKSRGESIAADELPNVVAQLIVYDLASDDEGAANVVLGGFEGSAWDEAVKQLEQAAGDGVHLEWDQAGASDGTKLPLTPFPKEYLPLFFDRYQPPWVSGAEMRHLEREEWQRRVHDVWPNQSLACLGGKTPQQAKGEAALSIPLAAAVYSLDAFCNQRQHQPDLAALRERLGIEPPRPIPVTAGTDLKSLSVMQLHRLPFADLSDDQLRTILNRVLLIRHGHYAHIVLEESLRRPALQEETDVENTYSLLARLCRERLDDEQALAWVAMGYAHAMTQERAFEKSLNWKVRELKYRLEDPDDPKIPGLLQELRSVYCPKIPELEALLIDLLQVYDVPIPWETSVDVVSAQSPSGETTDAGIWVPSAEAEPQPGKGKLWLPGSD